MDSAKRDRTTTDDEQAVPVQPATDREAEATQHVFAEEADESTLPPIYKMQDLMQHIAGQSDLKRAELRAAAGQICAALGAALQDGRTVSLPGLGKITPRKRTVKPAGDILTARIKLPAPARDAGEMSDPEIGESELGDGRRISLTRPLAPVGPRG